MGGVDGGFIGQGGCETTHRMPLIVGLAHRQVWRHQIGTAHTAVEQRPAGEHDARVISTPHGEGNVVGGVAGSVDDIDGHRAHFKGCALTHGRGVKVKIYISGYHVGGAVARRKLQSAGDVIVVHMRFGDMSHGEPMLGKNLLNPINIALGVDHQRMRTVVGDVTTVTEAGRVNVDDMGG